MQADHDNKYQVFADKYEGSDLKRRNARALSEIMNQRTQNSEELTRELAIKTETTNPWYFGVWTLLRVRHHAFFMKITTPERALTE